MVQRNNHLGQITGRNSWMYQFPGPAMGIQLDGDETLAKQHVPEAMSMMYKLKNYMKLGLLGSHTSSRILDDGTEITVLSFFGNDRIVINAPAKVVISVEESYDFIFKITRDDDVLMTNDPSLSGGVTFYIYDPETLTTYTGMYPTSVNDYISTMVVLYNDGLWTLRKRAVLPTGEFNLAGGTINNFDIIGDHFDQDVGYFVYYQFTGVSPIYYNQTQYPGKENSLEWENPQDAITPGYYEDTIKKYILIGNQWYYIKYLINSSTRVSVSNVTLTGYSSAAEGSSVLYNVVDGSFLVPCLWSSAPYVPETTKTFFQGDNPQSTFIYVPDLGYIPAPGSITEVTVNLSFYPTPLGSSTLYSRPYPGLQTLFLTGTVWSIRVVSEFGGPEQYSVFTV